MSRCSSGGAEAGAAVGPGAEAHAEAHAQGGRRGRLLAWGGGPGLVDMAVTPAGRSIRSARP